MYISSLAQVQVCTGRFAQAPAHICLRYGFVWVRVWYGYGIVWVQFCPGTGLYGDGFVRVRVCTGTGLYGYGFARVRVCSGAGFYGRWLLWTLVSVATCCYMLAEPRSGSTCSRVCKGQSFNHIDKDSMYGLRHVLRQLHGCLKSSIRQPY